MKDDTVFFFMKTFLILN